MRTKLKKLLMKLAMGPFGFLLRWAWSGLIFIELGCLSVIWWLRGARMPTPEQQRLVRENATFIFKSFQRQHMARRLYRNIQRYYPGARVIIADDSRNPLELTGPGLQIIQLPFNSGLSVGLNRALAQVQTPFTIRMDDDELITPRSNFHGQLAFLMAHPEVDLAAIIPQNLPLRKGRKVVDENYYATHRMENAPTPLTIPAETWIDEKHIVLGKVPNIFIARTDKYRRVGYDENIRMIDHHEFFFRAAGTMVSVLDESCSVVHYHNIFDYSYETYRYDIRKDLLYIKRKHTGTDYFR